LLLGGNYLDYDVLAHDPVHGQHLGILLIEFGVGTTVAAVMITIFYNFAGRGRARDVDDGAAGPKADRVTDQ
jgi:multicomponent Na+:H+ antiporter subunit B